MAISGAVLPSSTYVARLLQAYLSSHPLFYNPLVVDGSNGNPVAVERWRLYEGFPLQTDLFYCTVTPYAMARAGAPLSTSATAVYDPYELGKQGQDKVTFTTKVAFDYLTPVAPDEYSDTYMIPLRRVWGEVQYHPDISAPLNGWAETTVQYNPWLEVVSEYLELTRLALHDSRHQQFYLPRLRVANLVCTHSGLLTGPWEQGRNILQHSGYVMVQTIAYVSRHWWPTEPGLQGIVLTAEPT